MFYRNRLESIHFLRFIAAAAVVVHHVIARYEPKLIVGAAGVDLFFVISGLVIGLAMASGETVRTFAIRRAIRIYPLYWIATGAYGVFRWWAWSLHPTNIEVIGSVVLWPTLGANWHPIYWPAWTLQYEILFYVIAALFMAFSRSSARVPCAVLLVIPPLLTRVRSRDYAAAMRRCFGVMPPRPIFGRS